MFNEKSGKLPARVYLVDRQSAELQRSTHVLPPRLHLWSEELPLHLLQQTFTLRLCKRIQGKKTQTCYLFSFSFPSFHDFLDFQISVLVPGLGLLATNYPIKIELKY